MLRNHVREKLKNGQSSVGTWLTLPDPVAARLMSRIGFDWLTVELEHTPVSLETAAQSFAVIAANGTAPLARVPWNTGENIKRVLDTGAWGIVVPMVKTRAEAELAVSSARYAPLGQRSIGGQLHAASFDTDPATYYAQANEEILVVLMIEHIEAIQSCDSILSVPGIDAVFIGPNDLHHSMGKKPVFESDDSEFVQAVDHLLARSKAHGVPCGIHVVDGATADRRIKQGFQFIAVASETGMMLAKAREIAMQLGLKQTKGVAKY